MPRGKTGSIKDRAGLAHRPEKVTLSAGQVECRDFAAERKFSYLGLGMGGGKTLISIKALQLREPKPILVVCPSVAQGVWRRETKAHGEGWFTSRSVNPKWLGKYQPEGDYGPTKTGSMTVVSYNMLSLHRDKILSRMTNTHKTPFEGYHLIFDEAHKLKDPESTQSQVALGTFAQHASTITFLSGTASPNGRPNELWTVLFTCGKTDLDYDAFVERYCYSYEVPLPNGEYRKVITGPNPHNLEEFKSLYADFLIIRTAEELAPDGLELPPFTFDQLEVEPGTVDIEAEFPDEFDQGGHDFVDMIINEQRDALNNVMLATSRGTGDSVMPDQEAQVTALALMGGSTITYRRFTGLLKVEPVFDYVIEQMLKGKMEKVLLGCWFKPTIEKFRRMFDQAGIPVQTIHGGHTPQAKTKVEDWFQQTTGLAVVVGQIVAAGEAITLTAANWCIIVEPSHVPGQNAQFVKRIHRIGQTRPCVALFVELKDDEVDKRQSRSLKVKSRNITKMFTDQPSVGNNNVFSQHQLQQPGRTPELSGRSDGSAGTASEPNLDF